VRPHHQDHTTRPHTRGNTPHTTRAYMYGWPYSLAACGGATRWTDCVPFVSELTVCSEDNPSLFHKRASKQILNESATNAKHFPYRCRSFAALVFCVLVFMVRAALLSAVQVTVIGAVALKPTLLPRRSTLLVFPFASDDEAKEDLIISNRK
jgi:hypothetical protein